MTLSNRRNPKFSFVSKREKPLVFDLERAISEFLYNKRIEKRSPKTLEAYEQTLNQFRKWYGASAHESITLEVVRDYIHYLTFEKTRWDDHPTSPDGVVGLSARTVNNIVRNMKIFFNQLVRERIISYSPMDAINYQTEKKDTFEVFTDDEVKQLLEAPNKRIYTGIRDTTMMLVLADCGLRIGELTQFKISDVDLRLRQITVRAEIAKTNSTRIIPISKHTAKELEKLISYMNVNEEDYLWLTQFGERYYADSFAKMLKKYGKKAGITSARVSPHTWRHYFAVKFLRSGGDPIALARLLGHTSLNMTQVYVKYSKADLHEQHEKASPVANLIDSGNERKRGRTRFK
ncbi:MULTISPECIES: tyrosine-type recombinase/integrase [unclassified Paenibacillus]|uniref:tyrosine-type recombinase/integrase n=1 Tax=unclassified Paenibacillus TaxID=185978 RepID=UPI00363C58EF